MKPNQISDTASGQKAVNYEETYSLHIEVAGAILKENAEALTPRTVKLPGETDLTGHQVKNIIACYIPIDKII